MKPVSSFFIDPSLLTHALTHRSYCNEHSGFQSNERLEFLGDSVLSLIISERLYKLFSNLPEGELTNRRSLLVQTSTLADCSKELGLDSQLLLSKGEQDLGGRQNPGLLANAFEAVLGALYLDSGLAACRSFLDMVFPDSRLTADVQTKDPKSLLQELAQAKGLGTPIYRTVESFGPDHAKTFTVAVEVGSKSIAQGSGASKQKAETEAAKAALANLFPEA
jgi:ribonuclease-3